MKIKTSITLSEEVLASVDEAAGTESRSAFVERVLRTFLRERALQREQDRDRRLLDEAADRLNAEAEEVLQFQSYHAAYDD